MDHIALEYSWHAQERMRSYLVTADEIEAIVWYPVRRRVTRHAVEHFGYADDGRPLIVVTDRTEHVVITITDVERRRSDRRYKERRRRERRRRR